MIQLQNKDKKKILTYLKNGTEDAVAPGYVVDHVTGERTDIELIAYTDGMFDWTTDQIYHFETYGEQWNDTLFAKILAA